MADISKITLPDGSSYNLKDDAFRKLVPVVATITSTGEMQFENLLGSVVMSIQLPVYDVSLNRTGEKLYLSPNENSIMTISSTSWYLDSNDNLVMD